MDLKHIRNSKNLSQLEAAQITNISLRTYKRLELDPKYIGTPKYIFACEKLNEQLIKSDIDESNNLEITVIGAGYVGLSIATLLADTSKVVLIDIDEEKIKKINNRVVPFYDKDLAQYLKTKKLNLYATKEKDSYLTSDIFIICVPTNWSYKQDSLDMILVKRYVKEIRKANKKALIVIKSTIIPGYLDTLKDQNVIFSPEFLTEGNALKDNLYPSRIVIGAKKKNNKVLRYAKLIKQHALNDPKVLFMSPKEAESVKLFANAYLAMRVAFFNELDTYSIKEGLQSENIIRGVSLDNRIGDYYNNPSFGFGGSCLPKDNEQLIKIIKENDNSEIITSILESNESRKKEIADNITNVMRDKTGKLVRDMRVGIYSTYAKGNNGNSRNSAILDVMRKLEKRGIFVEIFDKNSQNLKEFVDDKDLIIANRVTKELLKFKDKIYTRDIFGSN